MTKQNKELRAFFANYIYDEIIDSFEFELIKLRDFIDVTKIEFELSDS
jgi:hypothetical protein